MTGICYESKSICVCALDLAGADMCRTLHAESFTNSWSLKTFEAMIADSAIVSTGLAHNSDASLLGYIFTRVVRPEAEILTVIIDKDWRSRGLGTRLFFRHLESLQARGIKSLFLEVAENNESALSLYYKCGGEEVGVRRDYYSNSVNDTVNAITMKINIENALKILTLGTALNDFDHS